MRLCSTTLQLLHYNAVCHTFYPNYQMNCSFYNLAFSPFQEYLDSLYSPDLNDHKLKALFPVNYFAHQILLMHHEGFHQCGDQFTL